MAEIVFDIVDCGEVNVSGTLHQCLLSAWMQIEHANFLIS
jgi:hypothetical protein